MVSSWCDYKYGTHEDVTPVYETGMGLSEGSRSYDLREKRAHNERFPIKIIERHSNMPMHKHGVPDLSD